MGHSTSTVLYSLAVTASLVVSYRREAPYQTWHLCLAVSALISWVHDPSSRLYVSLSPILLPLVLLLRSLAFAEAAWRALAGIRLRKTALLAFAGLGMAAAFILLRLVHGGDLVQTMVQGRRLVQVAGAVFLLLATVFAWGNEGDGVSRPLAHAALLSAIALNHAVISTLSLIGRRGDWDTARDISFGIGALLYGTWAVLPPLLLLVHHDEVNHSHRKHDNDH